MTQAVRDGPISKACRLLSSSDEPHAVDAENALRALHPLGVPATVVAHAQRCSFDFTPDQDESAIKTFSGVKGWSFRSSPVRSVPFRLLEMLRISKAATGAAGLSIILQRAS